MTNPDAVEASDSAAEAMVAAAEQADPRPRLGRDASFWGLVATQFLGALNDNLFKQLMLLLAVPVGAAAAQQSDSQSFATVIFALPFVMFSGLAGYLSDRNSKRTVIVLSKYAEIVGMTLGMIAFLWFGATGYAGLLVVLFLMGAQSSFFGPGKYGILPELFRKTDLPRANGIIIMTTFVAIILGTVAAGALGLLATTPDGGRDPSRLWIGSAVCIGVAILGTMTSHLVRVLPAADPGLKFSWEALLIPKPTRNYLRRDWHLAMAILASSVFWLVSGIAIQSINSLGMVQLELNEFRTSILAAAIAVGICTGAVLAGRLSAGRVDFRIVSGGAWGMFALMLVMSVSLPGGRHLLQFWGSLPVLALLGVAVGCFAIPLQVFIQSRPPAEQKGQMVAVMNQANFTAILLSGVIYGAMDNTIIAMGLPRSALFAMMAALVLPLAVFYRPSNDIVELEK